MSPFSRSREKAADEVGRMRDSRRKGAFSDKALARRTP